MQAGFPSRGSLTEDRRERNTKANSAFGLLHRAGQSPESKLCLQFKVILGLLVTKEQKCCGPARLFVQDQARLFPLNTF